MGDRASIIIESESFEGAISLYGHYAGTTNALAVATVLERTDRVGDPSYLTAQVFYEYAVSLNDYKGNLGFGIGAYTNADDTTDDNPAVYLNADTGEVRYDGYTYTALEFALAFTPKAE